jgi:hypothetical protein
MMTQHPVNSRSAAPMLANGTVTSMEDDIRAEQLLRHVLGLDASQVIPEEYSSIRQEMKLRLYPGEYVVYIDRWREEGESTELVCRTVLFHDDSMIKVQEFIASLPEQQRRTILVDYIDMPLQTTGRDAALVGR